MSKKRKVVLYSKENVIGPNCKTGKYIGNCPSCNLTLYSLEVTTRSGKPDAKGKYAKCGRCESISMLKSLKPYKSINDAQGMPV